MNPPTEHQGRCLCGAVQLTVTTATPSAGACHCGMCRRWGGGPLLALDCGSAVSVTGIEQVAVYASSDWAERAFCRQCGTHLFYRLKQSGQHFVPVGLLDDQAPWVLDHQVFIDEKPAFYDFANPTRNMTGAELFAQFGASAD